MKLQWLVVALAGFGLLAVDPASAKPRYKGYAKTACAPMTGGPTFNGFIFNGEPRPNGCSPAVFAHGRFIGQDPDPNIRFQLMRQPETGYTITK